MHAKAHEAERRLQREQVYQLTPDMEYKVVEELLPGSELTRETRNLANCLRLFLDVKDANYHVIQTLTVVRSFDEWKVEEDIVMEEFGYKSIAQTRSDFHRLVLTRMRMEANMIQADLKPQYLDEANLYNSAIPTNHDGESSPVHTGFMVVPSPHQDQSHTEQGDEDAEIRDKQDVPVMMTPREIEQILNNHTREAVNNFSTKVDKLGLRLDK